MYDSNTYAFVQLSYLELNVKKICEFVAVEKQKTLTYRKRALSLSNFVSTIFVGKKYFMK